jgi:hypothetical protein
MKGHNIHSVDVTSDAFRALPTNIQHEILLELKDTRKQSSWSRLHQMPQVCNIYTNIIFMLYIYFINENSIYILYNSVWIITA